MITGPRGGSDLPHIGSAPGDQASPRTPRTPTCATLRGSRSRIRYQSRRPWRPQSTPVTFPRSPLLFFPASLREIQLTRCRLSAGTHPPATARRAARRLPTAQTNPIPPAAPGDPPPDPRIGFVSHERSATEGAGHSLAFSCLKLDASHLKLPPNWLRFATM